MPEDNSNNENKLSIAIEVTGSEEAVKALNAVDEAQKRVAENAEKLKGKVGKKSGSSGNGGGNGGGNDNGKSDADKENAEETQNAAKEVSKFGKGVNITAKSLATLAIAFNAAKRVVNKWARAVNHAAGYYAGGKYTGLGAERLQQWRWALSRFGGDEKTALSDMMNLQANLEMAKRGENPWGTAAMQLLGGNLLSVTPGLTQEEFLKRLAPRLKELSRDEAIAAGRAVGLSEAMVMALREHGDKILDEVTANRNKAVYSEEDAKKAQETKIALARTKEYEEKTRVKVANKLLQWLVDNPILQEILGTAVAIVGDILDVVVKILGIIAAWNIFKHFIGMPPPGGGAAPPGGGGGGGTPIIVPPATAPKKETETSKKPAKAPEKSPVPDVAPPVAAMDENYVDAFLWGALAVGTVLAVKGLKKALASSPWFAPLDVMAAGEGEDSFFAPDFLLSRSEQRRRLEAKHAQDARMLTSGEAADKVIAHQNSNDFGFGYISNSEMRGLADAGYIDYTAYEAYVNDRDKSYYYTPEGRKKELQKAIESLKKKRKEELEKWIDPKTGKPLTPGEGKWSGLDGLTGAFNYPSPQTDTPLNSMSETQAAMAGRASVMGGGNGGVSVDATGTTININAPTGNANDIMAAIGNGASKWVELMNECIDERLYHLDRLEAGTAMA